MGEKVLVVDKELIFSRYGNNPARLIEADEAEFTKLVNENHAFICRDAAEADTTKKQIIPYCVVTFGDYIYLTQRTKKQTEKRLHNKRSVGVGGHINPPDIEADNVLLCGMERELLEEMNMAGSYAHRFLGLINDDSTEVGSVHTGACYLIKAESFDCRIRETDKMTGQWVKRENIRDYFDGMEEWSQIALASILEETAEETNDENYSG